MLAGGAGDRFGGDTPKQFALLAGEPVFVHPLRTLVSSLLVEAIVVVLPPMRDQSVDEASRLPKVCSITRGGPTRQASLQRGLASVPPESEVVLVHDAARPLMEESQVRNALEALQPPYEGAICAIPLEDSLKEASEEGIVGTVSRQSVWRAQTPQVFDRVALQQALEDAQAAGYTATDCSELLTRAGFRVCIVEGDPLNFKLTRPADLRLAELVMRSRTAEGESQEIEG